METASTTSFAYNSPSTPGRVYDVNDVHNLFTPTFDIYAPEMEKENTTPLPSWVSYSPPRSEHSWSDLSQRLSPCSLALPAYDDQGRWHCESSLLGPTACTARDEVRFNDPNSFVEPSATFDFDSIGPIFGTIASATMLTSARSTVEEEPAVCPPVDPVSESKESGEHEFTMPTSARSTDEEEPAAYPAFDPVNESEESGEDEFTTVGDNPFPQEGNQPQERRSVSSAAAVAFGHPEDDRPSQRQKESLPIKATTLPESLDIASAAFKKKGNRIFKDGSKVAVQVGLAATLQLLFKKGCFSAGMEGQEQPKIGEEELLSNVETRLKEHERGPYKGVVKALLGKFQATGKKSKYFNWKRWLRAGLDAMPALFEITSYKKTQVRHFTLQTKWGHIDEGRMNERTMSVIDFINSEVRRSGEVEDI
uniref:Uncharacterized protein n=1 Tax=Palpitomonas bilix TaxID=652834 RepID=A0A7S3D7Y7_9EUKA|mmetsp:Transcript_25954/g.65892  ORF Transcript_25954/g.65892 Transcript_25954/m.65892 type:complete len:422 (+) Transcript_25954:247-1512(+)